MRSPRVFLLHVWIASICLARTVAVCDLVLHLSVGLGVSCPCEWRACPSQRAYPPFRSRTALRWSIPIWISWALGTVYAQLFVITSPRLELRLRYLVSCRDVRHGTWQWRCRLHRWSVCHSNELPEPESQASPLFAAMLGLPELVYMITVTSTSFTVNWTSGICAVF